MRDKQANKREGFPEWTPSDNDGEYSRNLEEQARREAEAILTKVGPKRIQRVIAQLDEWQKLMFWLFDSLLHPTGQIPQHVVETIFARHPAFKKHMQTLLDRGHKEVLQEFIEAFGIWGCSRIRSKTSREVYKAAIYFWPRTKEYTLFSHWCLKGSRIHYGEEGKIIPDLKTWLEEYKAWGNSPEAREYLHQMAAHLVDLKGIIELPFNAALSTSLDPFRLNGLAPFASAFPAYGAAKAIFAARRGWPTDEEGRPRYVFEVDGNRLKGRVIYHIILPWDATEDEVTVAHKELAWNILKSMGPDTAWLHMLLLAYAVDPARKGNRDQKFVIPREEIYRCLGLDKRTDLSRKEKDQRAFEEVRKLRSLGLQITHLHWVGKKQAQRKGQQKREVDVFNWDRRLAPLWDIWPHEFGQAYIDWDESGKPVTRYKDWQLVGREGLWGDIFLHGDNSLRQFGYLARDMLTKIDRYHCPWGAALAVMLTFQSRFDPFEPIEATNREIIEFAGGEEYPIDRQKRYDIKQQVLNAIEEQRKWGLEPDYSLWPEHLRPGGDADKADNLEEAPWDACPEQRLPAGYWDDFLRCKTFFRPAKGSQAETVAQANRQVKHLPEAALLPMLPKPKKPKEKAWVGSDIKELREKLGLTQRQLAAYLGVTQVFISQLETGKRKLNPQQRRKLSQLEKSFQEG